MGGALGVLLVAVLASAAASLQTTFIPVARTVLAMSTHEALPASYARVHPRYRTPGRATGLLVLGFGIMLVMRRRSPAFFRGEIRTKQTPALTVPD